MKVIRLVACALACVSLLATAGPSLAAGKSKTPNCAALHIDAEAEKALAKVTLPPPLTCSTRTSNGFPIPDPSCTPGAVNPTVTLDVLSDKRFRTDCIRDKATTAHKKAVTYDWYGIEHPTNNTGSHQICELDHLVSLELGGADTLDNI